MWQISTCLADKFGHKTCNHVIANLKNNNLGASRATPPKRGRGCVAISTHSYGVVTVARKPNLCTILSMMVLCRLVHNLHTLIFCRSIAICCVLHLLHEPHFQRHPFDAKTSVDLLPIFTIKGKRLLSSLIASFAFVNHRLEQRRRWEELRVFGSATLVGLEVTKEIMNLIKGVTQQKKRIVKWRKHRLKWLYISWWMDWYRRKD